MQASNYAFITALYVNKSTGLYKDIYFPIIKYAVVTLYNNRKLGEDSKFMTSDDICDFILKKVRIKIPPIVISMTLKKMNDSNQALFDMELMENGNTCKINEVFNESEFNDLDVQEKHFSEILNELEQDYQDYLTNNGCYDDGVSFLQLISDNTEEFLGYFENEDKTVVDEKYTTVIFFLEYLKDSVYNHEKFHAANQLFWASIIAAYLRSDRPLVDADEDGVKYEYFLDTSIVMGLLELASAPREAYAKDLSEIIKASGGIMRVHPMTLKEISKILVSVELRKEPMVGTDIAVAWNDKHYNVQKLAGKRVRLQQLVEEVGISVFPNVSENRLSEIETEYKSNPAVTDLSVKRSGRPPSYSTDNFREIHDVFMGDYIHKRRKEKKSDDTITFVTSNRELIDFTNNHHPGVKLMKSSGRIILELWMHNAKPTSISNCALTETMARCLDMHNAQVRSKLVEVSRYFKMSKENFDPQVYKDFIKNLYRRAKHVITAVEEDINNDELDAATKMQKLANSVAADLKAFDERLSVMEQHKVELEKEVFRHKEEKESLTLVNATHKENISKLEGEKQELSNKLVKKDTELNTVKEELDTERKAREEAERISTLYKRKAELEENIKSINVELEPLLIKRKASFKNWKPYVLYFIGGLLLALGCWLGYVCYCDSSLKLVFVIAPLTAFAIYFFNRAGALNDRKKTRQEDAYKIWEGKVENKRYTLLVDDLEKAKVELDSISEGLK